MAIDLDRAVALSEAISYQTYFLWVAGIALSVVAVWTIRSTYTETKRSFGTRCFVWFLRISAATSLVSVVAGFGTNLAIIGMIEKAGSADAAEHFHNAEVSFVVQAGLFLIALTTFFVAAISNARRITDAVLALTGKERSS